MNCTRFAQMEEEQPYVYKVITYVELEEMDEDEGVQWLQENLSSEYYYKGVPCDLDLNQLGKGRYLQVTDEFISDQDSPITYDVQTGEYTLG